MKIRWTEIQGASAHGANKDDKTKGFGFNCATVEGGWSSLCMCKTGTFAPRKLNYNSALKHWYTPDRKRSVAICA
eukprot:748846-Amphidinium_carterae.2